MKRKSLLMSLALFGLVLGLAFSTPAASGPRAVGPLMPSQLYLPLVMRNAGGPSLGGCPIFPGNNPWNTDISNYPVHSNSDAFIADINATGNKFLHADFGSNPDYGIPYIVAPISQTLVSINFTEYGNESDPGPYPIPSNAPIEAGSDAHVLVLQSGNCMLYELYHAQYVGPVSDSPVTSTTTV